MSANGNYWRKLSEMLHENIKIKILLPKSIKSCIVIRECCAPERVSGPGKLSGVSTESLGFEFVCATTF